MDAENPETTETAPVTPLVSAPPIHNRFLFVDIAALRAKQLRRGALPRLQDGSEGLQKIGELPHKAERVAMEEVRRGLVPYDIPVSKKDTR
jgi:DNA-directed RNA polymerase subunit K/omega